MKYHYMLNTSIEYIILIQFSPNRHSPITNILALWIYRDQADWFMKADDDTYVIVENLRLMLSAYKPAQPIWFGCKFKVIVPTGYMSGGAGKKRAMNKLLKPQS